MSKEIYLKDYRQSDYLIDDIDLEFDIYEEKTIVTTVINFFKNPETQSNEFHLNGQELEIKSLDINGKILTNSDYRYDNDKLFIHDIESFGERFKFKSVVSIDPQSNTALEGLYKSGNIYCTQNEPEGFRRITFYLDRPDVMAKFTTKIIADKTLYPTLLANGNCIERGDIEEDRHFCTWKDPFKKPAYLFAIVAGDLGSIKDKFKTMSGREIDLEIYCDRGNENRCYFAMESLKKSMKWDEDNYGLEYDLDIYMIVAVDSFNMGAMENKGLNIFNSSCVLADSESATDQDYAKVEAVIAHEYFHNWTGNRVTCRDWFQLTLKEGLTVFRDQEFSSDMQVRAIKRIEDVNFLKKHQFKEDQGPMAHPIRPKSYIEINNFYTLTVYEKGSEVIRMIYTILGEDGFRKGIDKYFELYDGQAVTTDNFIYVMEEANGYDFTQFKDNWYNYPGTPILNVSTNIKNGEFEIKFIQSPSTICKNNLPKNPYVMPMRFSLYDENGHKVESQQLVLTDTETIVSIDSDKNLVPSINEGFTAPVKVNYEYSEKQLALLMENCEDSFNLYEIAQTYHKLILKRLVEDDKYEVPERYLNSYKALLLDETLDPAIRVYALRIPGFDELIANQETILVDETIRAIEKLSTKVIDCLENDFLTIYERLSNELKIKEYDFNAVDNSIRLLHQFCLGCLGYLKKDKYFELAKEYYFNSNDMTSQFGALKAISYDHKTFEEVSQDFYQRWKNDNLVFPKWIFTKAGVEYSNPVERIDEILKDQCFDINIPNQVRYAIQGFAYAPKSFHRADGKGYRFVLNFISEYDSINPSIASGLINLFSQSSRLDEGRKAHIKEGLQSILDKKDLSKNSYEIATKTMLTLC